MANIFVRSTDGNDADNGSTWALAKATLGGAAAIDAAGDTIFVSDNHAESISGAGILLSLAGTKASPTRLLCVDDAGDPSSPTTLAATATAVCDNGGGPADIQITGDVYVYGISFRSGLNFNTNIYQGSNGGDGGHRQVYERCQFRQASGGFGTIFLSPGNAEADDYVWKNCDVSFSGASCVISVQSGRLRWEGGSVLAGSSAAQTSLFRQDAAVRGGFVLVSGVDLSNLPAAAALTTFGGSASQIVFRNCKLPASWSGGLVSGTLGVGNRAELYNCDSGSTNYVLWVEDYAGSVKHETTLVRTGGTSDGTTALSWKMAGSANAKFPLTPLRSPEIARWNDTVGVPLTVTVDVLHDSVTNLKDDEVWIEVQYLGTSGVPLSSFTSDAKASVLATAADQTASSSAWTTTGTTNPNKQKLSVTFTPQKKGQIRAVVHLAKASYTVYVDPVIQVS